MITSQLPVGRWHDIIGDPTYADAILDRLIHNAHRIELSGESLRWLGLFEQRVGLFKWFSALVMLPPLAAPAD
jgi:hypothetical protein